MGQGAASVEQEGSLIDGRNRLAACRIAGVDPRYTTLNGEDPIAYIRSHNVRRRNLTQGQLAMVEVKLGDLSQISQRELHRQTGISQPRIGFASTVLKHAPDLADMVMTGAMPLDTAYAEAKQRKEEKKSREEQQQQAERDLDRLRMNAPELSEEGLSQRQIADVLGVSHKTVDRDLDVSNDTKTPEEQAQMQPVNVSNDTDDGPHVPFGEVDPSDPETFLVDANASNSWP